MSYVASGAFCLFLSDFWGRAAMFTLPSKCKWRSASSAAWPVSPCPSVRSGLGLRRLVLVSCWAHRELPAKTHFGSCDWHHFLLLKICEDTCHNSEQVRDPCICEHAWHTTELSSISPLLLDLHFTKVPFSSPHRHDRNTLFCSEKTRDIVISLWNPNQLKY